MQGRQGRVEGGHETAGATIDGHGIPASGFAQDLKRAFSFVFVFLVFHSGAAAVTIVCSMKESTRYEPREHG